MNENQDLRPANDVDKRYLEGLKKCAAHKELVVAAALHYCAEAQVIPPKWVLVASSELMCELLKREKAQTRGRAAGHLARYRQDMRNAERANAVNQIRMIRERVRNDSKLIDADPSWDPGGQIEKRLEKMRQWLRHGTFACASMYLYGSYARAGAEAIKASYRRVQRAHKDPLDTRYWYIDPRFLWQVGIDDRIEVPGTKFAHLYNLTP